MSHLTKEEANTIHIDAMRVKLPDLINLLVSAKNNEHLSEEEREVCDAAFDTLNDLGSDYSDEDLVSAWKTAQLHMKTLPKWGAYW